MPGVGSAEQQRPRGDVRNEAAGDDGDRCYFAALMGTETGRMLDVVCISFGLVTRD
jgi:hypothetical protein